jgi:hypothetical protein
VVTSRSPLKNYWQDPRVEFVAIDFLEPVETVISKISRSCEKVTHAYYTSYVHTDDFAKLRDYNVPLFKTFLVAIDTVAGQNLQRICLQTGGKVLVPCLMLFISVQDILIFMRSTTGLIWVQCFAQ